MKNCLFIITLLYTSSFSALLFAQEFAYVTDSLQLRVYAKPSDTSEILQTIESGDSVEVFTTQDGFSQVTTYDGTVGWVKAAFLVDEPPAKLLYYSVGEKNKELEAEIESLKNAVQTTSTSPSSESDVTQIKELQTALAEQQKTNQELQHQLNNADGQTQFVSDTYVVISNNQIMQMLASKKWWLTGLAAALLFAGLLLGMKLSSWRMKKRLHGFRI